MSASTPSVIKCYIESGLDGLTFSMIEVPGGSFSMGDDEGRDYFFPPKPAHKVSLDTFYIGQYSVTQELWKAVMRENLSYFRGNHLPVELVSWEDVQLFLEKLNDRLKLEGKRKYRLPTEAEWEYAARGGPFSQGSMYAGGEILDEVAWHRENSERQTHEVGSKAPNELGIYDISGNVREWCMDRYSGNYYQECYDRGVVQNPKGPETGFKRVRRGGSWTDDPIYCRVADRGLNASSSRSRVIGFRLSRTTL